MRNSDYSEDDALQAQAGARESKFGATAAAMITCLIRRLHELRAEEAALYRRARELGCDLDAEMTVPPKIAKLPSPDEIKAAATNPNGSNGRGVGWTKEQLAEWGIMWPPRKGWRQELEARWYREHRRSGIE